MFMTTRMNLLATGHFQPGSIAVRILTFYGPVEPDMDFFAERIKSAIKGTGNQLVVF